MPITRTILLLVAGISILPLVAPDVLSQQTPIPTPVPKSRLEKLLFDAETATGLSASGRLLYNADENKRDWGQYCRNSVGFANRGEFRQAVREASKALFLGEVANDANASAHASRDLAYAYSFAGDLEKAEEWATRSLKYLARARIRERGEISVPVHKILGDIALRRNDIETGIKHYQDALSEAGAAAGPIPMASSVPVKISIANAEIRRGRNETARGILTEIGTGNPTWAPFVSRAYGQLALAERDFPKAIDFFANAVAGLRDEKDAYHLMWMQHGLAQAYRGAGDTEKALGSLRDAIASAGQLRAQFRSEEFRAGFFGEVQSIFDDAIELLVDSRRFDEALALSEESRARALLDILRGNARGEQLDTAHAVAKLPSRTAGVVYHVLDGRTVAWTVRSSAISATTIPAGRKEISALTERFRRAVVSRAPDTKEQGRKLYELLVQPLGLNAGEAMIVVPHKALHYLPFNALTTAQGYLIEERAIATVPSLNAMLAITDAGAPKTVLFALGNPDLEEAALALPGAEQEVRTIGGLFADAQVFVRQEASKARFISQAPGKGLIHVAAHATVDEIDPLYSSIRLARGGQPRGELEAREILNLNLSSARLVTLSGCESGLGKVKSGDEFFGFKRSFLSAGARSLLVSLWPVEDESTASLMSTFYRELRERPMIEALRQAQLTLLKTGNRADPVFWAPFVLVGDWQ